MSKKKKYTIFMLIILIGGVIDQFTKALAIKLLSDKTVPIIKDVLEFKLLYNTGAAWSFMRDNTWALVGISLVLCLLLIIVLVRIPDNRKLTPLVVLVSLIISGAIGNLIDRVVAHKVTDFIYFKLINFPVFNVADIYVSCSTVVLIILIMFYYDDEDFEWLTKKKSD